MQASVVYVSIIMGSFKEGYKKPKEFIYLPKLRFLDLQNQYNINVKDIYMYI